MLLSPEHHGPGAVPKGPSPASASMAPYCNFGCYHLGLLLHSGSNFIFIYMGLVLESSVQKLNKGGGFFFKDFSGNHGSQYLGRSLV